MIYSRFRLAHGVPLPHPERMTLSKAVLIVTLPLALMAQQHQTGRNSRRLITEEITNARMHTLTGNTHARSQPTK